MNKRIQNIYLRFYLLFHNLLHSIAIALYYTEEDILKADSNNAGEGNKKIQRMRSRNNLLEKFYAGTTDEKYVREYYEVLKKADKFIKTATPHEIAVSADKHGMKDRYGRRYGHDGFYDAKHKYYGKTIAEILLIEFEERRTKDDDYEILHIFNNVPIEVGFSRVLDVVEKKAGDNDDYIVNDMQNKSKKQEFPLIGKRKNDVVNKIEQLSEFLHVKKIGFEFRLLEFFIPLKYKTSELSIDSNIFKELINIDAIYIKDDYGRLLGYSISKFTKRINYNNTHDVLKFEGIEMSEL